MRTLWGFVMGPACHLPSFVTPRCEMLDPFGAGAGPLFGLQKFQQPQGSISCSNPLAGAGFT